MEWLLDTKTRGGKGIVTGIRASYNEAVVVFEGDGADEFIEIDYLRPF
ncbi:hypothetical protein [Methanosarcina spelaei]|nr:hypothetical protein [Methanosarcina spelaei]